NRFAESIPGRVPQSPRTKPRTRTPMTKPAIDKPVRRNPTLTSYAVLWSMLGTLGVTYLGVAIFQPDWLAGLTPASLQVERDAESQETLAKLNSDVDNLRASMANLQIDLASVKAE